MQRTIASIPLLTFEARLIEYIPDQLKDFLAMILRAPLAYLCQVRLELVKLNYG